MSNAKAAAQLIIDCREDLAYELLKGPFSCEDLKLLSLLLRKHRAFDEEFMFIQSHYAQFSGDPYIAERYQWHAQSFAQKLVARQSCHIPQDEKWLPNQQLLQSLCFVTGGNQSQFDSVCECIESLRQTKGYKNCRVFVLDFGFTEEQSAILSTLNITTVRPDLSLSVQNSIRFDVGPNNQTILTVETTNKEEPLFDYAKLLLNQLIPNYQYYFWLNPNTWIQDERVLDKHFVRCCEHGLSATLGYMGTAEEFLNLADKGELSKLGEPNFINDLLPKRLISSSVFCIDGRNSVYQSWCNQFVDSVTSYGFYKHLIDFCLTKICSQSHITNHADYPEHFTWHTEGFAIVCGNDDILRAPGNLEMIGIMDCTGIPQSSYFVPTQQTTKSFLHHNEKQFHAHMTQQWLASQFCNLQVPTISVSMRFKTWPWDTQQISEELVAYAQEVLCHA